MTESSTSQWNT